MFQSAGEIKNAPGIRELPLHLRVRWINLQKSFKDLGMNTMAYPAAWQHHLGWQMYLDAQQYQSPFSPLQQIQFKGENDVEESHPANIDLSILFHPDTSVNEKTWQQLDEQLYELILCVSAGEIAKLKVAELRDYLTFFHRAVSNFPFSALFQSIKTNNQSNDAFDKSLPDQLWNLFKAWIYAIRQMGRFLPLRMSIEERLFNFPDALSFKRLLPSAQFLLILLQSLCIRILDYGSPALVRRYLDNAHPEVRNSLEAKSNKLYAALDREIKKEDSFEKSLQKDKIDTLKKDFLKMIALDQDLLLYQEVILNESGAGLLDHYHLSVQREMFSQKGDFQTWLESLASHSITDRVLHLSAKLFDKRRAAIWPDWPDIIKESVHDRFLASERSISSFKEYTDSSKIPKDQLQKAQAHNYKQWKFYFLGLCNQLTFPFFKYSIKQKQIVVQWNLLSLNEGEELLQQREAWQSKVDKNRKELDAYLDKLEAQKPSKQKPLVNVPKGIQNDPTALEQIHKYNNSLEVFKNYRLQKMIEFGILNNTKQRDANEEIWLNELLTIEKEISPYVIFVKKAFQGALPVRKTVIINHDRHSADGVDFDPQTTQDPDKWMRGDIMSTMSMKIKRGNAAQVNCFVLDASGSMEHDRMRNLFKILCLMVYGLEDRKSYDAFHFFSYNFIEAAKFSGDYTNRGLLFKIMKSIAKVRGGKVEYGGEGGTNMGEGIAECHRRMETFHKALQQKNPNTIYLKSLFVITDGEPSVGIIDPNILNREIKKRRENSQVAIKGIYLKSPNELSNEFSFMEEIFGKDEFVESDEFAQAINELVYIMAQTYKKQRVNLRYLNKKTG